MAHNNVGQWPTKGKWIIDEGDEGGWRRLRRDDADTKVPAKEQILEAHRKTGRCRKEWEDHRMSGAGWRRAHNL